MTIENIEEKIDESLNTIKAFKLEHEKKSENMENTIAGLSERVKNLEQQTADGFVSTSGSAGRSLSVELRKSAAFSDFMQTNAKKSFAIEVKSDLLTKNTITQESGSPATPNDTLAQTTRVPGIVHGPERRLRIRDLLPKLSTSSNKVEFTREASFSNNAAPQDGEGSTKAETTITFELAEANVVTIAHFIKVSKQALDDADQLAMHLDRRMTYGVLLKEEDQLLNGDGTSHAMSGLLDSGNFTTFTPTTGDSKVDVLRKAITALQLADYQATGIILHPQDWQDIELLKDAQDRYLFANPQRAAMPQLWGVPVVPTNSIAQGTFLVGDFDQAAAIHDRQTAVVEMGYVNDDFTRNLVTIRAEERLALTVYKPAALRSGAFM